MLRLFPHYIPLNLFSKFNENDKLLSECGICPSYIRRIMARSSHTPDTAGTGNDGRQIICRFNTEVQQSVARGPLTVALLGREL